MKKSVCSYNELMNFCMCITVLCIIVQLYTVVNSIIHITSNCKIIYKKIRYKK